MSEFTHQESPIDLALLQAIDSIGDTRNGIISHFGRNVQYYDDPKFFQYYSRLKKSKTTFTGDHGSASGFSFFSRELAVLKCLSEALERYAIEQFDHSAVIYKRGSQLDKPFVPIDSIVNFSDSQRAAHKILAKEPNGYYGWVLGESLPSHKEIYLPAQLVYLFYRRKKNEQLLRLPVSTGAATGTSLSGAVYRGICEIIERDAFMISYLNKLPRSRVAIEQSRDPQIQAILQVARNYNLELSVFDLTTDIEVYTFVAVLTDRTGIGPAVMLGLKSGLNPHEAMLGAMQEVFHPRTWVRREMENFEGSQEQLAKPVSLSHRGILWSNIDAIVQLDFLLKNKSQMRTVNEYKNRSTNDATKDLSYLVKVLTQKKYHVYYIDITPRKKSISKTAFKVVDVLIPELQPMHLDERHPYFGGQRLYEVPVILGYRDQPIKEKDLNPFPHPFL